MKRLTLLIIAMTFCTISHAENVPITFTDKVYSDGTWYPSNTANVISVNNKDGLAWRFVLNDTWTISSLSGFMTGVDTILSGPPQPGRAQFYLYQGSTLYTNGPTFLKPLGSPFYTSTSMDVPLDGTTREYKQNVNLELPSGDYWFRADGGANDGHIRVEDFKIAGSVTTPEPATLLLLGGGLLAGFRMRRRK